MTKKTYSIMTAGGMSYVDMTQTFSTNDRTEYLQAWSAIKTLVELNVIDEAQAHDPSGIAYAASEQWIQVCLEDGIAMQDMKLTECLASGLA